MDKFKRTPGPLFWLLASIALIPCRGESASPAPSAATGVTPGFMPATPPGDMHDFDFLAGAWTTQQRRLQTRGVGSTAWRDAPPNQHCARSYLDGKAIVDESRSPDGHAAGLFLYSFDPQTRHWSIYWVDPQTGQPDSGTFGGFDGTRGEFYADDEDGGRPVKVRVTWIKLDRDHARWEQAFSFDRRTWETNWIADYTRADAATVCSKF